MVLSVCLPVVWITHNFTVQSQTHAALKKKQTKNPKKKKTFSQVKTNKPVSTSASRENSGCEMTGAQFWVHARSALLPSEEFARAVGLPNTRARAARILPTPPNGTTHKKKLAARRVTTTPMKRGTVRDDTSERQNSIYQTRARANS